MKIRRGRDLNPGGAMLHRLSRPTPYLARLSQADDKFIFVCKNYKYLVHYLVKVKLI